MTPDCLAELQQLSDETAARHHVASISWGVVSNGTLATHGATGTLANGSPVEATSVYRIASMTKSFTAAAVLALRDDGVWQLDDPIERHAPELATVRGPGDSPPITLRHLLSMGSGLATDDAWADRHLDFSAAEIDRVYAAGPLFARATGTGFEYSNLGFAMLGRAVLRATGTPVQQHISDRLLAPLGMTDTTWVQPAHDRWARPHRWLDDAIVIDQPAPIGDGELAPMGGLWTTVADLARWVSWLDDADSPPGSPAGSGAAGGLSPASRREMQQVHTYIGMSTVADHTCPAGYGFGLNIRHDPVLGKVVAHAGGLPGYGSNMRWLSGRGVGAIALGNTTYAPMGALTMQMLDVLHRHEQVRPIAAPDAPAWTDAAHRLVALFNEWDHASAAALFADNVDPDDSFDRRAATARQIVTTHGTLEVVSLHPSSATGGTIRVRGNGSDQLLSLTMDLSPLAGGWVQQYEWAPVTP